MWIGRQRGNIFGLSYGNSVRLGSVSEDLRVRSGNRFKLVIDKLIKDF